MKMLNRLKKAIYYVPKGQFISLGEDTFLTGYLDGSDKIYGFGKNDDGDYVIVTRDGEQPFDVLTKNDLTYIFNLSHIFNKIKNFEYPIEYIN